MSAVAFLRPDWLPGFSAQEAGVALEDPRDLEWVAEKRDAHVTALGAWQEARAVLERESGAHDDRQAEHDRRVQAAVDKGRPLPEAPGILGQTRLMGAVIPLRTDNDLIVRAMFASARREQELRMALHETTREAMAALWQRSSELHRLGTLLTTAPASSAAGRELGARLLELRTAVLRPKVLDEIGDVFRRETRSAERLLRPSPSGGHGVLPSSERAVA